MFVKGPSPSGDDGMPPGGHEHTDAYCPSEPPSDPQHRGQPGAVPGTTLHSALAGVWRPLDRKILFEEPRRRDWLLNRADEHQGPDVGFMPRSKALLLAAAGGVGKTMLLCRLGLVLASGTGQPWAGRLIAADGARGAKVLLAFAEEDYDELHRRLWWTAKALRLTPEQRDAALGNITALPLSGRDCRLTAASRNGDPFRTDLHAEFAERMAADGPWALAVLDPLTRFAGAGAEVSQESATAFVEAVESLIAAPGLPSVLVAHHTNQASRQSHDRSATAARGVTATNDGFRWHLHAAEEEGSSGGIVGLTLVKSNYTQRFPETFYARRDLDLEGALVPLVPDDLGTLEQARRAADPATRKAEAKAERVRTETATEEAVLLASVPNEPENVCTGELDRALRKSGIKKGAPALRLMLDGLRAAGTIVDLSDGTQSSSRKWARPAT